MFCSSNKCVYRLRTAYKYSIDCCNNPCQKTQYEVYTRRRRMRIQTHVTNLLNCITFWRLNQKFGNKPCHLFFNRISILAFQTCLNANLKHYSSEARRVPLCQTKRQMVLLNFSIGHFKRVILGTKFFSFI